MARTSRSKTREQEIHRDDLRRKVLANPRAFLRLCHPELIFERFHLDWFRLQQAARETLILAPRGHGKTTVCTCAYAVRRILTEPNTRALVVSRTADQAQTIAGGIRALLANDEDVRLLFGEQRGHPWKPAAFTVATRTAIRREPTVTAMGICGPLTSKHFDLILCDDVLDFENTRTRRLRERVAAWVGTALEPTLDPGGEIHWIGTRYHADDYYGRLLDPRLYAGLKTNEATRAAVYIDDDGRRRALWPSRFSFDEDRGSGDGRTNLDAERRKKGTAIFDAQYQNDVRALSGRLFSRDWFEFHHGIEPGALLSIRGPDGAVYTAKRIVQGFDPAIAGGDDADFSALVTIAVIERGVESPAFAVVDVVRDRMTFEAQVARITERAERWKPSVIGIEEVAYQKALTQTLRSRTSLPIKGVRRRTDKLSRAYALQGLFEERRIWLDRGAPDLTDELAAFPEGRHDDLFDALETAIELARTTHRPAYW